MTYSGYHSFKYKGYTVVLEKIENDWWIEINNHGGFEPRVFRRDAKAAAIRHIDAS